MAQESLTTTIENESRTEETRSFIRQVRRVARRKFTRRALFWTTAKKMTCAVERQSKRVKSFK